MNAAGDNVQWWWELHLPPPLMQTALIRLSEQRTFPLWPGFSHFISLRSFCSVVTIPVVMPPFVSLNLCLVCFTWHPHPCFSCLPRRSSNPEQFKHWGDFCLCLSGSLLPSHTAVSDPLKIEPHIRLVSFPTLSASTPFLFHCTYSLLNLLTLIGCFLQHSCD